MELLIDELVTLSIKLRIAIDDNDIKLIKYLSARVYENVECLEDGIDEHLTQAIQ